MRNETLPHLRPSKCRAPEQRACYFDRDKAILGRKDVFQKTFCPGDQDQPRSGQVIYNILKRTIGIAVDIGLVRPTKDRDAKATEAACAAPLNRQPRSTSKRRTAW